MSGGPPYQLRHQPKIQNAKNATKAITRETKHSNILAVKKRKKRKIYKKKKSKKLQLIKTINSDDAFVLINRHKHIYSRDKDNEPPWTTCTQHAAILALSEGVTYSGGPFLLFGFPSGLVL